MKSLVYILILLFVGNVCRAGSISGRVIDEQQQPLAGANVYLQNTYLGSASGADGTFIIENVPQGHYELVVGMTGFKSRVRQVDIKSTERLETGDILLKETILQGQATVVTAGKYEQTVQNVPASVAVIPGRMIAERNSVTLKEALEYIPGITMNRDQINIRSSSGFVYGVGSRVMLLLDGVPYLTGDTQEINYESLPVNQIDHVEVIKGAGSALYGSGAVGGVINVITKDINDAPETHIRAYGGMYDDPYDQAWKWSDRQRLLHGLSIVSSGKAAGLNYSFNAAQDVDDSFIRNDWQRRYQIGTKLTSHISDFQRLNVTANYMDQKSGNFLYWQNLQQATTPAVDQIGESTHSQRYSISSNYQSVTGPGEFYRLQGIWFHNYFRDNAATGGRKSQSDNANVEVQYHKQFTNHFLTLGASAIYNTVTSNIFETRSSWNFAAFSQDEWTVSDRWRLTFGLRADYSDIEVLGIDWRVNPKLGIIFRPGERTAFRASAGMGFRAPSMAEAFTSTVAGNLTVVPNSNLKTETSYFAELGINRAFSDYFSMDAALFYNRFKDLIDISILPTAEAQFTNFPDAQIAGAEVLVNAEPFPGWVTLQGGYTYASSRDLNLAQELKFRPRHTFYANAALHLSDFIFSADYRFISKFEEIDSNFNLFINDAEVRVNAQVFDARVVWNGRLGQQPLIVSVQANNLFQYNYTDVVGKLAPIRNFVLTLETSIK